MQSRSHDFHLTKQTKGQKRLHQAATTFRDVLAEARIASKNITDAQERENIYAETTDIVQHTIETIQNKPLSDTPTAEDLIADIQRRNRRFLPREEDKGNQ